MIITNAYIPSLIIKFTTMKTSKRITTTVLGIFGLYLYYRKEFHQFLFVNVQGRPLEEYDPQPMREIL